MLTSLKWIGIIALICYLFFSSDSINPKISNMADKIAVIFFPVWAIISFGAIHI